MKHAVVAGQETNTEVEYCGYKEQPLGYDYEKDADQASEYNESERSVEDQEVWDHADNVQEAIEEVLNKRGENEEGVDFDKIKNERLKLLAENDFDQDFTQKNPGFNAPTKDQISVLDILGDLQSGTKKLKTEEPKTTAGGGGGFGFKGFKKKNVKQFLITG